MRYIYERADCHIKRTDFFLRKGGGFVVKRAHLLVKMIIDCRKPIQANELQLSSSREFCVTKSSKNDVLRACLYSIRKGGSYKKNHI